MPYRVKKICTTSGCNEFAETKGKCESHKKKDNRDYNMSKRQISSDVYNWAWRKARASYLRENPLCVKCEFHGDKRIATEIDHIIPHGGDKKKFWDVGNWQSLCKSCHSKKTIKEWNK